MLLKFGDDHGFQGINPLGQRDLGNLVAELADGQGKLRHHAIAGLDPGMQREIYGYDLLLIVPVITPAEFICDTHRGAFGE